MYFDAHSHISSSPKKYPDIPAVIRRARENGVTRIVDSGIDLQTSKATLKLHFKYPDIIIPTLGLHPELVIPGSDIYQRDFNVNESTIHLKELYKRGEEAFKAVGECGLDYYWLERNSRLTKSEKLRAKSDQKLLFTKQIEFAKEVHLPLVAHSRGAEVECLSIINGQLSMYNHKSKELHKVLFHSFTGNIEVAKKVFKAGYYISFNGIITYKSAGNIREIFKFGWSNFRHLILSETDAPYLAPQVKRGEICEPADVRFIVEKMAEIVDVPLKTMAKTIVVNAERLFLTI